MKAITSPKTSFITATILAALLLPVCIPACGGDLTVSTQPDAGNAGGRGGTGETASSSGVGGNGGSGGNATACVPGSAEICYTGAPTTVSVGSCKAGAKTCLADGSGYDDCVGEVVPVAETCNALDDDCNGSIDNGVLLTYYADGDNDAFGDALEPVQGCSAPLGFVSDGTDCDDANPDVHPGTPEVPNGYDDNCNGQLNEGVYFNDCKSILAALPGSTSGPYTIDPDGPLGSGSPFEVSCDMTSNGGGWTLLARSNGNSLNAPIKFWLDVLSQNFFFTGNDFATNQNVPANYLASADFFAILHAAADLTFSEVRLNDGKGTSLQNLAAPKTLRMIHGGNGTEALYRNGVNTGILLLLGNANNTQMFPCYYPSLDGQTCQSYFNGDQGNASTAFYVGDLTMCAAGPASGDISAALWGSGDCYATDSLGGDGGFTFHRPFHANVGRGGYVESGFNGGAWSIQIR